MSLLRIFKYIKYMYPFILFDEHMKEFMLPKSSLTTK